MKRKSIVVLFLLFVLCGCANHNENITPSQSSGQPPSTQPASESVDNSGPKPAADEADIDFKVVERLIVLLDSDEYPVRKKAKEDLLAIGNRSLAHKDKLGPYLAKQAKTISSPEVDAALGEIIHELGKTDILYVCSFRSVDIEFYRGEKVPFGLEGMVVIDNPIDLLQPVYHAYLPDYKMLQYVDFKKRFVLVVYGRLCPQIGCEFRLISAQRDYLQDKLSLGVNVTSGHDLSELKTVYAIFICDRTSMPIEVFLENQQPVFPSHVWGGISNDRIEAKITPYIAQQLIKDARDVATLKKYLDHKDPYVRREAIKAIGALGTDQAIEVIINHIKTETDDLVLRWAVIEIAKSGKTEAYPVLRSLLLGPVSLYHIEGFKINALWAMVRLDPKRVASDTDLDAFIDHNTRGSVSVWRNLELSKQLDKLLPHSIEYSQVTVKDIDTRVKILKLVTAYFDLYLRSSEIGRQNLPTKDSIVETVRATIKMFGKKYQKPREGDSEREYDVEFLVEHKILLEAYESEWNDEDRKLMKEINQWIKKIRSS